jgi:hypothetical protein
MNELLSAATSAATSAPELDLVGSLVDAGYNRITQLRLPGAEKSCFLAWFENHNSALAISPSMARGAESISERF